MQFHKMVEFIPLLVKGVGVTLEFTVLSTIAGFILGIIIAVVKVSNIKPLKWLANFYTSIFRGTPLLVQLFIIYYATPQLFDYKIPALNAAVITFGLNSAAYISESLRGGIQAVDKGQKEAAMALGVSYFNTMVDIIFPQALKHVLPALVNESIALLKDSSLVATIGVMDVLRASETIMNTTFIPFEPLIIGAAIYYVLIGILTLLADVLERRVNRSDRS
ncbi:MAG: amino acid transporter rane protein, family [Firmicutes bacterium]|nr:amino acid transporter rane protein, family [Bacillota bacterium]